MKSSRFQLVAMWFFITGFVCANSGWSPVFSIWMSDRPEWSVCGEDLCLCVKPSEQEPSCPLCVSNDEGKTCSNSETPADKPSKRVPRNPHADAISQASQLGSVSVFIAFVFGSARTQAIDNDAASVRFADPVERVALNQPDIPTPPPRS